MKIIEVTKDYFKLGDGTVIEHIEPLDKDITIEDFQKIYNTMENIVKCQIIEKN
jgi:hypothetical protein